MLSYKPFHLLISIKTGMLDYCKFEIIMKNNSFLGILYFFFPKGKFSKSVHFITMTFVYYED